MAPNKASKPQTEQPAAVSNVGEEEENLDLHTNLDMNEKINARKDAKRKQLSKRFDEEMEGYDRRIAAIVDSATKEQSDLHHDQQRRLYKLAQRRSEIEEQIVQHAQILDKACISASRELEAAAKGRLQDLEQGQDEEEQEEQAEGTEEADTEHRDSQEC